MARPSISIPDRYLVLAVDDEADVHAVTKLTLKGINVADRKIEILTATSGKEAVEIMRQNPNVAVILLDVVMETDSAGLDACRAIREQLDNPFVRILLRTGQPGQAPERQTIESYDIDGYLPKAELTSTRLFSAVRTAIKAWLELVELDRHRRQLATVHDCVVSLHSYDDLDVTLSRILAAAVEICPTALAALLLETFQDGNPRRYLTHLSSNSDEVAAQAAVDDVVARIAANTDLQSMREAAMIEGGFLVPIVLHRELGYGWIYLETSEPDELVRKALPLLAAHGANALYSTVAQAILKDREGPLFDSMPI